MGLGGKVYQSGEHAGVANPSSICGCRWVEDKGTMQAQLVWVLNVKVEPAHGMGPLRWIEGHDREDVVDALGSTPSHGGFDSTRSSG